MDILVVLHEPNGRVPSPARIELVVYLVLLPWMRFY